MNTRRLTAADPEFARRMFAMMSDVFDEASEPLGDAYLERILRREDFWAIVALDGTDVIGGLTAHALPMTRSEASEVFIYDVAVRTDWQRRGVGTALLTSLREGAGAEGIDVVFVPADVEDVHALDFYRAAGGIGASVEMFTWSGPSRAS